MSFLLCSPAQVHPHPHASASFIYNFLFDRYMFVSPRDRRHVDWVRSYLLIWTEMQAFIKQHHTTGLVWSKSVSTQARCHVWIQKAFFLPLLVQYCAVLCYTHHLLIPEPESLLLLVLYNVSCVFIWFLFARLDRFISAQNNFYHF